MIGAVVADEELFAVEYITCVGQTAIKMYKLAGEEKYLLWSICSIHLQDPQKHQKYVSHVLGLPMSKVVCKTKRIGGGFGGRERKQDQLLLLLQS